MRYAFKQLPGQAGVFRRPVVPVVVEGFSTAPQECLLDTGSLRNRFDAWIADSTGIDLSGAAEEVIALGGFSTVARTVRAALSIGDFRWEAPVSFCDPWPMPFQVLGQEGFFRWFKVTIRAAEHTIDVEPEER